MGDLVRMFQIRRAERRKTGRRRLCSGVGSDEAHTVGEHRKEEDKKGRMLARQSGRNIKAVRAVRNYWHRDESSRSARQSNKDGQREGKVGRIGRMKSGVELS